MSQRVHPTPRDELALRGLRVHGHHGILDFEREHGQEFVVDVVLRLDTGPAASSGDLAATVDYSVLADRLAAAVSTDPVDLIETLAERLAEICLHLAPVADVDVTVHKPQAPLRVPVDDVSVSIHRSRP
jgi:7,8-dihydroneopterin aldolase/epimerase/oxygenase